MRPIGWIARLAERSASAEQQTSTIVEPEVEQELARVRGNLPKREDGFSDIVSQRLGRNLVGVRRDYTASHARPQFVGIPVGAHDKAVGADTRAALRAHDPARSFALKLRRARVAMDRGASCKRRAREAARMGERLHCAPASVDPPAKILRRAKVAIRFYLVEHLHRRATACPLLGPASRFFDGCF